MYSDVFLFTPSGSNVSKVSIQTESSLTQGPTPTFLVNLTWRAGKGCVTKISSMCPQELIEVAQPWKYATG